MLGVMVGAYRITRLLGEGGMGSVYEAINDSIERRVAIKILNAENAKHPDTVARFFNEARAVNRIAHPSIVQIHEHGRLPDGTAYIVMEYLDGQPLNQRLRQLGGRMPPRTALQIAWQVAAALSAAHGKGIVHRDLKPGNLMLVPDPLGPGGERVKVLDFGIAKLVVDLRPGNTASHIMMGTPTYMSPEQCRGAGAVDEKTDVYSLGAILYELLSGRPPFVADGMGEIIGMHLFHPTPPIRNHAPELRVDLAEYVHLLLHKDKNQRPTMLQAAERLGHLIALDAASTSAPISVPPHVISAPQQTISSPHAVLGPHSEERTITRPSGAFSTTESPKGQKQPFRRRGWRWWTAMGTVGAVSAMGTLLYSWSTSSTSRRYVAGTQIAPVLSPVAVNTAAEPQRTPSPTKDPPVAPAPAAVPPAAAAAPDPVQAPASPSLPADKKPAPAPGPAPTPTPVPAPAGNAAPPPSATAAPITTAAASPLPAPSGTSAAKPTEPTSASAPKKPVAPASAAPTAPASERLRNAEALLRDKQWREALRLASASDVIAASPGPAQRIIGVAACHLRSLSQAETAYLALSGADRQLVAAACRESGAALMDDRLRTAEEQLQKRSWKAALDELSGPDLPNALPMRALRVIGIAACYLNDHKVASE